MNTNFSAHGGNLQNLHLTKRSEQKKLKQELFTLPKLHLNARQLCDLELLMNGGFSPLTGFMDEETYSQVITDHRLPNKLLWPMPIVLDIDDPSAFTKGQDIALTDEYGKPIAKLSITSIYKANKDKEARTVYETTSTEHVGVRYLMHKAGAYYLGGNIVGVDTVDRFDFIPYRFTPVELREWFAKNNWTKIIGFQTRNPIHRAHFSLIEQAAQLHDAKVLLHPSVGLTKEGDIDYITRVRIYIRLHRRNSVPEIFFVFAPVGTLSLGI